MLKLEDIYDVTVAKDGQEAYEKVKVSMEEGLEFNLIFMDIQVRFTDSIECRLLKSLDAKPRWFAEYSADTSNGLFCTNCRINGIFRGEQRPRVHGLGNGYVPQQADSTTCPQTSSQEIRDNP